MTSPRSLLYTLAKLLALPWLLATYQLPSPAGPARQRQGSMGPAEEDVELVSTCSDRRAE
ncbi:MAG: hypothetical protein ACE1ZD_06120 [Dehalococcoidia bacterium]